MFKTLLHMLFFINAKTCRLRCEGEFALTSLQFTKVTMCRSAKRRGLVQEKQHTDELKHGEELRKVQEEVRLAREAATKAEERRLAAEKAANQARGAATEAGEAASKERASKSRSAP